MYFQGCSLPFVEITLDSSESIKFQGGGMSRKAHNVEMLTGSGGIGKRFTKEFTGGSLFHNLYTAVGGPGSIAFSSSFPGNIIAVEIRSGKEIECRRSSYFASTPGVELSDFFRHFVPPSLFESHFSGRK